MGKTILIVEDDEDTRSIYSSALEEVGYRVLTATQGAEGVHLARRFRPDLILLDLRMPVMNGWGTARYLNSDSQTRSIPIWAISAYDVEAEGADSTGGSVRFDRYLRKPLDPRDLVSEVRAHIGVSDAAVKVPDVPTAE